MLRDRPTGKQRLADPGVSPELVALIKDLCPLEVPFQPAVGWSGAAKSKRSSLGAQVATAVSRAAGTPNGGANGRGLPITGKVS
jgi:hypothetical protein